MYDDRSRNSYTYFFQISGVNLQNPSDPDATFRTKGKEPHIGYVTNLVEVRDKEKKIGLILNYDVQPNVYSDAEFGEIFVENHALAEEINKVESCPAENTPLILNIKWIKTYIVQNLLNQTVPNIPC